MDLLAGMRMLVRVADAGSFSAAARQLGVAPSSVSRQIGDLEDELGARLFQRTTRKLALTESGQRFYADAQRILLEVDEARLAIGQAGQPSGILRFTAPTAIARELLIDVVPAFLDRYPGVRVVMTPSDELVDLVESGIDVAVRVGRMADSTLRARRLGTSRRVLFASPDYLDRHGVPAHPSELAERDCISFRSHPGTSIWQFRGEEGLVRVPVTGRFFARSSDGVVAAALAGLGFALMPDWNLLVELRSGALVPVLEDYELVPADSPVWAVHAHQRHVPPKVRAFIDHLGERFAVAAD